ncbi:MAG TPA: YbjN domain-containing protein [Acidimicrobiales bacterium]|nr:YbjN domain-containing protein [Acidimicrobiales bacterium]
MPLVDLQGGEQLAVVTARVDAWIERERSPEGAFGLVAAERQDVTDRTASHRWYLRFRGDEKDAITVWLTLRQRTLHHEAQFMPAPEEHREEVLRYLMRRNAELYGMAFCLGAEDAVYLMGRVPAALVDDEELDRIAGSSIVYVDDHYPTAMSLGHPAVYRRRLRRR